MLLSSSSGGSGSALEPKRVLALHCSYCQLLTLSVSRLLEHLMSAHADIACDCCLYQCSVCAVISTSQPLLQEHASVWHHDQPVTIKCISQTRVNGSLNADSTTTSTTPSSQVQRCTLCPFTANDHETITSHYRNSHHFQLTSQANQPPPLPLGSGAIRSWTTEQGEAGSAVAAKRARGSNDDVETISTSSAAHLQQQQQLNMIANSNNQQQPCFMMQQSSSVPQIRALPSLVAGQQLRPALKLGPQPNPITIDLVNETEDKFQMTNSLATFLNQSGKKSPSNGALLADNTGQYRPKKSEDLLLIPNTGVLYNNSGLDNHSSVSSTIDPITGETIFTCPKCGNVYNKRRYFNEHTFCCVRDKPFPCVCGRSTKWRSNLYAHRKKCALYQTLKRTTGRKSFGTLSLWSSMPGSSTAGGQDSGHSNMVDTTECTVVSAGGEEHLPLITSVETCYPPEEEEEELENKEDINTSLLMDNLESPSCPSVN